MVHFVGAGSGAVDLITVRGARLLVALSGGADSTALLAMLVVAAIIVIGVYAATDKRANPDT